MVLCKYFLNGNCRFGAKCVNEHLDIKQLVKSDVESAVNGNQWPLSCFGPFKEKPSIPNFIDDQSFEEIRMLCYGSKKQNFFDSFNQQFTKEVLEAKNKLKMLLTLNKEVMDVVINLYNSSEQPKGPAQQNSNPFGLGAATNAQQSTSIFGNSTSTQGSIFGSSPFGGASNTPTGNSIFGGGQKSIIGQSAFSSFAGQAQQQQQQPTQTSGLFSSLQSPQQQSQQQTGGFGGNIFSQPVQQAPGGASIFSTTPQQPQPFGVTNTSPFGQPVNSGNIFAQAAQQTQQQPAVGGNIFSPAAQQPQQNQPPAFGMFSQPTQQAPPPFGAQMTQQSPFGAAQQRSIFGQTQQPQQQQQQPQQNPGNIFSTPMQKQQQQLQQQPFQAQQPPTGLFSSAVANSPFGSVQPQQQQQQQQQQPQTNIFAQAVSGFPQSQQQPLQQLPTSERTYSKLENLKPEEIEAFQAETFELGKIPFSPPPRELVN